MTIFVILCAGTGGRNAGRAGAFCIAYSTRRAANKALAAVINASADMDLEFWIEEHEVRS